MHRILSALSLSMSLSACYRYVPLPTPTPVAGTEVRSFLTPEGSTSMATTLGRNVSVFDGRLLSDEQNAWRFAVSQTRTAEARAVSWSGEPITVPRSAIARMELRVLDRSKTIRAAIIATVGGVALGFAIKGFASVSGTPSEGGGNPPP
ncbi:MAG: hypothetical protein ACT4P7_12335 [Gemmatimonadaceae bacterium]